MALFHQQLYKYLYSFFSYSFLIFLSEMPLKRKTRRGQAALKHPKHAIKADSASQARGNIRHDPGFFQTFSDQARFNLASHDILQVSQDSTHEHQVQKIGTCVIPDCNLKHYCIFEHTFVPFKVIWFSTFFYLKQWVLLIPDNLVWKCFVYTCTYLLDKTSYYNAQISKYLYNLIYSTSNQL